jgi:hypothetical protein
MKYLLRVDLFFSPTEVKNHTPCYFLEVIFVDLLTPKPVGIYQRISTTSIICHGFIVMKVAPDFVAFTNCLAPVSS